MRQEVPSNVFEEFIHSRIMMMLALNLNISMIAFRRFFGESIEDSFAYGSAIVAMRMMEKLNIDINLFEEPNLTVSKLSSENVKIEKDFDSDFIREENESEGKAFQAIEDPDDQMSSLNIKEEFLEPIEDCFRMSLSLGEQKDFQLFEEEGGNISYRSESAKNIDPGFQFPFVDRKRTIKKKRAKKISKQPPANPDARNKIRPNAGGIFRNQSRIDKLSYQDEPRSEYSERRVCNSHHSKSGQQKRKKVVDLKPTGANSKRKPRTDLPKMSSESRRSS